MSPHSVPERQASEQETPVIETDLLIIGTGPAGASLACFLASHGLKGIMIGAASGTAREPRAHITNPAALECLRDVGLEAECVAAATKGDCMTHTRWCYSMAGEEFARIHSWGNAPYRQGDHAAASPCSHVDLPQTLLEPILVRYAVHNGFTCRFDSTFLSFSRDTKSGRITSVIQDSLTGRTYSIRSKYLFGCDGARSQVIRQLGIPFIKQPGGGLAVNAHVRADMSKLIKYRTGNLHWIFQPDREYPEWGWSGIVRMVKPWYEWMFIFLPRPGTEVKQDPTPEAVLARVKEWIGDDSIDVKVLDVAKWYIYESVAERYSDGNIFCLGDAVHRHPPLNGLGSNTCVQDAFNIAWKLAYVERGQADPSLLHSFSAERQPAGLTVVTR
ncbi:hypothetical protein LTR66_009174, partial [Elasticomyces elasticus]